MRQVIDLLLLLLALYAGGGIIVAAWLLARGLGRFDPNARGTSPAFRVLVTPGLIGLWPLMLRRARLAQRGRPAPVTRDMRTHRRAHLVVWLVLTPLLLGAVAWLAAVRPPAPASTSGARP
jgi:hypothetical protein